MGSVLCNVCRQDGEETLQVLIFLEVLWEHLSYYSRVVIVYLTLHFLCVCSCASLWCCALLFSLQGIRQVNLIYLSRAHESVHVLRRHETKILLSPYTVFSLPLLEYWIEQGLFSGNLIQEILIQEYALWKIKISLEFKVLINQITTNQLPHCEPEFVRPFGTYPARKNTPPACEIMLNKHYTCQCSNINLCLYTACLVEVWVQVSVRSPGKHVFGDVEIIQWFRTKPAEEVKHPAQWHRSAEGFTVPWLQLHSGGSCRSVVCGSEPSWARWGSPQTFYWSQPLQADGWTCILKKKGTLCKYWINPTQKIRRIHQTMTTPPWLVTGFYWHPVAQFSPGQTWKSQFHIHV